MENLKRLLPFIKPHKSAIWLGLLCTLLSGAFDGAFILLAQQLLKPVLDNDVLNLPAAQRIAQIDRFVIIVLAVSLFRVIADYGQSYVIQRTGQRILSKIREELFGHFGKLSISFFERKRTGEVMSRLTNDVNALQSILTDAVTSAIAAPIALVGSLGFMLWANWKLTLFVVVILPPVSFLISGAGRRIRAAVKHLNVQNANLTNYLQEKVSAMRLIQTFGTMTYETEQFRKVNQSAYRSTMTPIRIKASLAPIIDFIGMCGVVMCLWFGSRQVIAGTMEASALLAFIFAMHRTAMRAKSIASLNLLVKSADTAASRLWEIFDTKPEIQDSPTAIQVEKSKVVGHLRFDNVRFSYGGPDVLHDINFDIKPGEVVALAGLSGSGKSTIAALLARLYDPTGGSITLDGIDLRDIELQSLRDLIGAVPQEGTLFHGTIRDNIAYGTFDAPLDQVIEAARRGHSDEFIRKLPEGYDAPIGERGGGFSGGQKQRLAISRALLRDPKLLILDEATSALDAESEGLVQDALTELMKGRTTLIIAHRFSTIVHADRIIVLKEGRIIESGSHSQLLAQRGQYFDLYQKQSSQSRRGDEELAETEEIRLAS